MVKYLILDSGALINLTQNCLIGLFKDLGKDFKGEFIIPDAVKYETIEHPLKIKRFEWGAIRIQNLLEGGIVTLAKEKGVVTEKELREKSNEVMNIANNSFFAEEKPIHLIERGEAECLALSLILTKRGIENAVAIDERTARMLCENAENLKELMEKKLEAKLNIKEEDLKIFQDIKVIRSTELVYIAFKKGIINADKRKLGAILYALKFGGCSISENEVDIMKKAQL